MVTATSAPNKIMLTLLLTLLSLCASVNAIQINERQLNDIKGTSGTKVEVVCQVDDLRDPLEDCDFYAPSGTKYSARSRSDRRDRNDRRRDRDEESEGSD